LRVAWPILFIIGATLFVSNHFYFDPKIDKLKTEVKMVTVERDNARATIEEQNKAIIELSKISEKVTREEIEELKDMLERMSEDNRKAIESIIDAGVPEGCEDSRQFLIDMINQLQWEQSDGN